MSAAESTKPVEKTSAASTTTAKRFTTIPPYQHGVCSIEYAKSGRAKCHGCSENIDQGDLRIGAEAKSTFHDGWDISWYHLDCCNLEDEECPIFKSITELKGWEMLRWDDYKRITKELDEETPKGPDEERRKKENQQLWDLKDELSSVPQKVLKDMLVANQIDIEKISPDRAIHKSADGMLWGKLGLCPFCKDHRMSYNGFEYSCHGWAPGGFSRCTFVANDFPRYRWIIPDEVKSKAFFKKWKYPPGHPTQPLPAVPITPVSSAPSGATESQSVSGVATTTATTCTSTSAETAAPPPPDETVHDGPEDEVPLGLECFGIRVVSAGSQRDLQLSKTEISNMVIQHGGTFTDNPNGASVMVSCAKEISKANKTKKVADALDTIPVLALEWLFNLCERKNEGIQLRQNEVAKKYLLPGAEMFSQPIADKYFAPKPLTTSVQVAPPANDEASRKRAPVAKKQSPKPGSDVLKVDPEAGAGEILVVKDDTLGYVPYSAVLNMTDIGAGTNKFYKLQVIKDRNGYKFFIKWGRTGTDVGDKRIYEHHSKSEAIDAFEIKFKEMTGNLWEEKAFFEKKGGKYFMVELDDGNENAAELEEVEKRRASKKAKLASAGAVIPSALQMDGRLRSLVSLIFDKEMMKSQLKSMAVDVKKMPLGKISKTQIQKAYAVLNSITETLQAPQTPQTEMRFLDASNRFYTLVPHDFGGANPPILNNDELVKQKTNLLDVLCDIEIANSLMAESEGGEGDKTLQNYQSLKTRITPLDKAGERYRLLEEYAYNTHDPGFAKSWTFTVDDIFEIEREGEKERFGPWANNANRQLLWHGSRLTNYVGILSQGMRIAPPEAPKTGYRFGKGVYFADCVSKSCTYCFATRENPVGVMILNEVAIGVPNKVERDTYMESAPTGTDSTWALGMAGPDPVADIVIDNGVKVPKGKIVKTGLKTACSHNEFIVYKVPQINIRYLLRVTFQFHS